MKNVYIPDSLFNTLYKLNDVTINIIYRDWIHSNMTLSGFPITLAFLLAAASTEITKQPVPEIQLLFFWLIQMVITKLLLSFKVVGTFLMARK